MDLEAVLKTRKSIRRFSGAAIDPAIIEKALVYGQKAPSAGGQKAYRFVPVTAKNQIEQLARLARQRWIKEASLVVVICADPKKSARRYGERGRKLYCLQDATLFGAHLDLYFVSRGLGTCWVGAFNVNGVKKFLNLNLTPISLLVVGHKDKDNK